MNSSRFLIKAMFAVCIFGGRLLNAQDQERSFGVGGDMAAFKQSLEKMGFSPTSPKLDIIGPANFRHVCFSIERNAVLTVSYNSSDNVIDDMRIETLEGPKSSRVYLKVLSVDLTGKGKVKAMIEFEASISGQGSGSKIQQK